MPYVLAALLAVQCLPVAVHAVRKLDYDVLVMLTRATFVAPHMSDSKNYKRSVAATEGLSSLREVHT